MNREQWLTDLGSRIVSTVFREFTVPPYRVACSWPIRYPIGTKVIRIGECHSPVTSPDGYAEICISPLLSDPLTVAGVLTHEIAHVIAGVEEGHGPAFLRIARHVGLTVGGAKHALPGPRLKRVLEGLAAPLGKYPHSGYKPKLGLIKPQKKRKLTKVLICNCGAKVNWPVQFLPPFTKDYPVCSCGSVLEKK